VSQNNSYVRNLGFPSLIKKAGTCDYKIKKCDPKVCTLRLDFESFTLLAGTGTLDTLQTCQDTLKIKSVSFGSSQIPTICGENKGEHIYVEIGPGATETATIEVKFAAVTTSSRSFEIKVTQYHCDSANRPPEGCLQYHTGTHGTLKTFNFGTAKGVHLASQDYSICIRKEAGFCCNKYTECSATNSFTLDVIATTATGLQDTNCKTDFVTIEGSAPTCGSPVIQNRYCGSALTAISKGTKPIPICQCQAPFIVGITTDNAVKDAVTTVLSHGVCLDYAQVPC